MRADLRLGQIRSGQMKKDPPRSESDPLKVHISEIITALLIYIHLMKFIDSNEDFIHDFIPNIWSLI